MKTTTDMPAHELELEAFRKRREAVYGVCRLAHQPDDWHLVAQNWFDARPTILASASEAECLAMRADAIEAEVEAFRRHLMRLARLARIGR